MRTALPITVVLLYMLATSQPALAKVTFLGDFESGDLNGWGIESPDADNCRIVTEPIRGGKYAVRLECTKDQKDVANSKRCEIVRINSGGPNNDNRDCWFGWSLYIPKDWQTDPKSPENVTQWHELPDTEIGQTPRSPQLTVIGMPGLQAALPTAAKSAPPPVAGEPRQMEKLGRGVVAINQGDGNVFVSWRLLGTEPDNIAFNLYRTAGDAPVKLNAQPLANATGYQDTGVDFRQPVAYFVRPVLNGQEQTPSTPFKFTANAPARPYLSIPLQPGAGIPNDASVGDLDGDGEYEIVLKREDGARDNAQSGITGNTTLEAYKLDGRFMWKIDLGRNIRGGAHYTQFMVYDLDADGKAEIVCKTADGTTDGVGKVIGDAKANYLCNENGPRLGKTLEGPEFLTVFDGKTGAALATTDYLPPRGDIGRWGDLNPGGRTDNNGNRADRFLACVAYLDGTRPSVVMCRGYYGRAVLVAWNWRDANLTRVWTFDTDDGTPANQRYRGQGNHGISVADVDRDGKDEIIYGAAVIDHDGKGLYTTGLGHGDAMHLSVLDPSLPGLQVWAVHEKPSPVAGAEFRDAATGKFLWGKPTTADNGRGMTADIDPRYPGSECWSAGVQGLFSANGNLVNNRKPRSCNFAVWWDGRLLRNLLDQNRITTWNPQTSTEQTILTAEGCASNNGTKATPCLSADILGDWREEVIWRTTDNKELRIYTTTHPTDYRIYTLMHDPVYRLGIAWQNVAYNQPPHTGFWLGEGMESAPRPNITLVDPK
ncbi:MAG: heparin lyase I family protein [Planctomycetota bacterium]|nr:heparin lyase I family protein [Planctomycetota bacterium]